MKRYGPVGSKWNSRKYLRMHNESISRGLKAYWQRKRIMKSYEWDRVQLAVIATLFMTVVVAALISALVVFGFNWFTFLVLMFSCKALYDSMKHL